MSIDGDIMDITSLVETHGRSGDEQIWDRVCKHINAAEATVDSATEQVSIANANVTSNNNLFNYLIDKGIIDREALVKYKIAANLAPSWTDDFVNK